MNLLTICTVAVTASHPTKLKQKDRKFGFLRVVLLSSVRTSFFHVFDKDGIRERDRELLGRMRSKEKQQSERIERGKKIQHQSIAG